MINSEQERLIATVSQDDYLNYQKVLTERAMIVLDFLRTQFEFEGEPMNMRVLSKLLPLEPTDPIFSTAKRECRAPLNGAIVAFADFLQKTPVFDLTVEPGPLYDYFEAYLRDNSDYTRCYIELMERLYERSFVLP
jgi:hypothetical protein